MAGDGRPVSAGSNCNVFSHGCAGGLPRDLERSLFLALASWTWIRQRMQSGTTDWSSRALEHSILR